MAKTCVRKAGSYHHSSPPHEDLSTKLRLDTPSPATRKGVGF